ncbi:MAG: hypothetical protein D6820_07025 [Lentisphaerae bacterium]|nr:MAG: hypothetical protein D6820_07025 [Lentisphaerota bacterium]
MFCYPADHTAKLALIRFAKDYFKDIRAFNEAWKTNLNSFDDLRQLSAIAPVPPTDAADRFAWRWLEYAEETWFKHWAGAIRKYDPNHLILGIRQHGHESPGKFNRGFWKIMGKYCDVISLNAYAASVGVDPERGVPDRTMRHFSEISEISGRPLINSEWFPNIHEEKIFHWYQPFMIAHPAFVGSQLFNWAGHPSLSYTLRDPNDPELSTFQPKPELERAARDVFSRLVEIRLHESPEKYTFKAPAARLWNRPLPPRREGPLPLLRSGPVELRKISEGWQLLCDGKRFQEFSPYVHQVFNQQNRWVRSTTHTILAWYQDAEFTVIDSVLSHPGDEDRGVDAGGMKPPKPGEKKAFAYELLIRTWVARQEPGVVATQILGLNNRSQGSWFLKSISMACKTQLAGSGKDDQPYNALQIYRAAGWTDPVVDIGYVAFSPDEKTGSKYRIWKTGRRAASREFAVNTLMVGAQSWAPELTPTAIHMVWKPSLGHARLLERIEQVVQRYCKSSQAIPYQSRIVDR